LRRIDVGAEQLGLRRLDVVDELELDAEVALDGRDLVRSDVVLEVDQDVVGVGLPARERGDAVLSLLGLGQGGVFTAAEVPPGHHDREEHEEPQESAQATALRILLVHAEIIVLQMRMRSSAGVSSSPSTSWLSISRSSANASR